MDGCNVHWVWELLVCLVPGTDFIYFSSSQQGSCKSMSDLSLLWVRWMLYQWIFGFLSTTITNVEEANLYLVWAWLLCSTVDCQHTHVIVCSFWAKSIACPFINAGETVCMQIIQEADSNRLFSFLVPSLSFNNIVVNLLPLLTFQHPYHLMLIW